MIKIILVFSYACIIYTWIIKTNVPKSLWGKKLMLNGPKENKKYFSHFDGVGHITSLVFKENETIISEVVIPNDKNEMSFSLSELIKRDYMKMFLKIPHMIFKTKSVQSGTRNTAVLKYNNEYYAVEESCSPIKLKYNNNDELCYNGKSKTIPRMCVHMPDNYTIFSYNFPSTNAIKFNNTIDIPWYPKKYPFLIHDCKKTDDSRYYIFPIMSTGMGRIKDYMKKIIDIPFDDQYSKVGWLIYDIQNHSCNEIRMDEFADIFHIAEIKRLYRNVHKIYASFVYNFPAWLTGTGKLDIRLKEVTFDIDEFKIIKVHDTGLKMDFLYRKGDILYGSCLDEFPAIIKYNKKTKSHVRIQLPGKTVREIIPYDDYFLYFSHDAYKSFLYITNITSGEVINKIHIPHRLPGFHTTLFD